MMTAVIPHCLGVAKEERHRFQDEAVAVIEGELKKIESGLEAAIEAAKVAKEATAEKLAAQSGEQAKLQEGLEAQRSSLQQLKTALAAEARLFQKAKTTRTE